MAMNMRMNNKRNWVALLGMALAIPVLAAVAARDAAVIRGGVSAAGGLSAAGPYAAALVYDQVEAQRELARTKKTTDANPITPLEAFNVLESPRRLVLASRERGQWKQVEIVRAERIDGPVCPKETTTAPVVAWVQRKGTQWDLCVYRDGNIKVIASASHILRNPLVAFSVASGLIVGCEAENDKGEPVITLYGESGTSLATLPGRHGRLVALPVGSLLLAERDTADEIWLEATMIKNGKAQKPVEIRGPRDYTFNADLAVDPAGATYIVAECAVAFGADCQPGLDRELRVWLLAADSSKAEPYPDAEHARIPVERRAFKTGLGASTENTPPIRPIVLCLNSRPVVAFREFRCRKFKDFGWDVYMTRHTDRAWSTPVRLTETLGSPDTGYALIPDGEGLLGVFPELENPESHSASYAHRVALVAVPSDRALPVPAIERNAPWRTPERFLDIAPAPPALSAAPSGFTLLWGDIHAHTCYSKCVGAANGMPDEMVRYQRDVLKLDVISLLEHTQIMGLSEDIWVFDRLEAEAGGRILIYGTEPGGIPGRHTNFYASNRKAFNRMCSLFLVRDGYERAASYRALLEALPAGETVALRHFHGGVNADDAQSATSFEPRLEVAMEAMQGRENNMLGKDGKAGFPSIYLNHGFNVGLVGGSDHFRETDAANRYCLTGFWVRERSEVGVWEALRNRRTLAVSNAKVAIWATLDGKGIGEEVTASGPLRFEVALSSARQIRRVTLIRDGEVLPWTAVGAKNATLTLEDKTPAPGRHWYVVTAEADSAYPQPAIAHASPIFVRIEAASGQQDKKE